MNTNARLFFFRFVKCDTCLSIRLDQHGVSEGVVRKLRRALDGTSSVLVLIVVLCMRGTTSRGDWIKSSVMCLVQGQDYTLNIRALDS